MLADKKRELDEAIDSMHTQRDAMRSILDSATEIQLRILKLKERNKRLFTKCLSEKDRIARNRMLVEKMENSSKIMELNGVLKGINKDNLGDFKTLKRMRKVVDARQRDYDNALEKFKSEIGLDEETMGNLMVGIYNKFQDEILEHNKMRRKQK